MLKVLEIIIVVMLILLGVAFVLMLVFPDYIGSDG